jgi:hypothetical protein
VSDFVPRFEIAVTRPLIAVVTPEVSAVVPRFVRVVFSAVSRVFIPDLSEVVPRSVTVVFKVESKLFSPEVSDFVPSSAIAVFRAPISEFSPDTSVFVPNPVMAESMSVSVVPVVAPTRVAASFEMSESIPVSVALVLLPTMLFSVVASPCRFEMMVERFVPEVAPVTFITTAARSVARSPDPVVPMSCFSMSEAVGRFEIRPLRAVRALEMFVNGPAALVVPTSASVTLRGISVKSLVMFVRAALTVASVVFKLPLVAPVDPLN